MATVDNFSYALSRETAALQAIAPDIDVSESSLVQDILQACAGGSAIVLYAVAAVVNQLNVAMATGTALDGHAADAGLTRIPATYAALTVTVLGAPNAPAGGWIVPAGCHFATPADGNGNSIVFVSSAQATVLSSSTTVIPVTAVVAGSPGNVVANSLTVMDNVPGVSVQSNTAPSTLAIDVESDTALRARIIASNVVIYSPAAAQAAALAVAGVIAAYANAPRDGSGNITVYAAQGDGTLPSTLQASVLAAVNAVRVAGTTTTVSAFTLVYAVVTVSIEVASGYNSTTVSAAVVAAIQAYVQTLPAGTTLQPGPMWSYVIANVLGLADWYTTSSIPTVASTALFRFVAPPTGVTTSTATTGGTFSNGSIYLIYTWSGTAGETLGTAEAVLTLAGGTSTQEFTVTAPATFPAGMTHLNIYANTATGTEQFQGFIATPGGAATIGSIGAGAAPPTSGTISAPTVTLVAV